MIPAFYLENLCSPATYIKEVFCVSRLEEHLERAYLEFPVLVELIELNAQCVVYSIRNICTGYNIPLNIFSFYNIFNRSSWVERPNKKLSSSKQQSAAN